MKIKPEVLLKNDSNFFLYKKILVTGSDESFIAYIRDYIVGEFKKKKYFIDYSGSHNSSLSGDLFSNKKILFLLKDYNDKLDEEVAADPKNQNFLIVSSNNKKVNKIKTKLLRSEDCLVVECYMLNRSSKEFALRKFIDDEKIQISNDVFWYIIDSFDNNYPLFIKQLETLSFFKKNIISIEDVEGVVSIENKIELNKIFFQIFKNNKFLINVFNKNIYSQGDFYVFLNSIKNYIEIIGRSKNEEDAIAKFPKYLFNEKVVFLNIYNRLNKGKVIRIYKNILKAESLVRKNSSLYFVIGLRFLLSTKNIITS